MADTALVVGNDGDMDAGLVGERLRQRGYELTSVTREAAGEWPDPRSHDLVLALGSAWSAYQPDIAPAVAREQEALRLAVAARLPVLAICFGAHLVASTFGGRTDRAARLELGWARVATEAPELVADGPWLQWHGDACIPPPGARTLASSDVCVQAFTYESVLAVQFHPEVTPETVERWCRSDPQSLAASGVDAGTLLAESHARLAEARSRAAAFVDAFLEWSAASAVPAAGRPQPAAAWTETA